LNSARAWLVIRKIIKLWVIQSNWFYRRFELPTAGEVVFFLLAMLSWQIEVISWEIRGPRTSM
jgi:hypothetical protein